jgi:DNA polymerase III delta prime subunit
MTDPIINPATLAQLDHMTQTFPHAVILHGPRGVGLTGVAEYIRDELRAVMTTVLPERNEKVDLQSGVISVSSIRRLYDQTKTTPQGRRLIVIDYAERMGSQAQNAFLKLLEEPGRDIHFLLLCHDAGSLLPTIRSRAQSVEVQPVTQSQSEALLDTLKVTDATKRAQLLFVANGLPAELQRLMSNDDVFQARATLIRDARTIVQGHAYDKLAVVQYYKDNREASLILLTDAMNMLHNSVVKEAQSRSIATLASLLEAYERVLANGNLRLQLAAHVV